MTTVLPGAKVTLMDTNTKIADSLLVALEDYKADIDASFEVYDAAVRGSAKVYNTKLDEAYEAVTGTPFVEPHRITIPVEYQSFDLDDRGEATGTVHFWCGECAPKEAILNRPDVNIACIPDGTICEGCMGWFDNF